MSPADSADTKERLLQAGMEVFAESGFADASVRRICRRADANTAALNYHFGDKQTFYAEVLATCHLRAAGRRPMPRVADDPEHPERVLRAFVRWFLELLLVEGSGPLGRLMAREMADPTQALDELFRRSILPIIQGLGEILIQLLPDLEENERQLVNQSIIGQCLFYRHTQNAAQRFQGLNAAGAMGIENPPLLVLGFPALDDLASHISDFSLAGIRFLQSADGPPI